MLVKALKLRGWNMIDPLFVSVCGMIAASLNLFKALYEKKIVVRWFLIIITIMLNNIHT